MDKRTIRDGKVYVVKIKLYLSLFLCILYYNLKYKN